MPHFPPVIIPSIIPLVVLEPSLIAASTVSVLLILNPLAILYPLARLIVMPTPIPLVLTSPLLRTQYPPLIDKLPIPSYGDTHEIRPPFISN